MTTANLGDHAVENLRYLLWQRGVSRERWVDHLAGWLHGDSRRAAELLRKGGLSPEEAAVLERTLGQSEEDLRFARLATGVRQGILVQNLRYLVRSLERGQQKQLAADLDVHPTTLSRWCAGKQRPERPSLVGLLRFFGLPAGTDLTSEPLFLSIDPISLTARRRWLHDRIEQLDVDTMSALFPALARMLEER